jgi:hypothetical protein
MKKRTYIMVIAESENGLDQSIWFLDAYHIGPTADVIPEGMALKQEVRIETFAEITTDREYERH